MGDAESNTDSDQTLVFRLGNGGDRQGKDDKVRAYGEDADCHGEIRDVLWWVIDDFGCR